MLRGWSMPLCPYWILLDRRIAIKKQNYIPFKPPKNPNISPISVKVQSSPISSGRVWLVSFRLRPVLHARSHAHFEPRALNNCSDKGQRHAVFVECKRLWKLTIGVCIYIYIIIYMHICVYVRVLTYEISIWCVMYLHMFHVYSRRCRECASLNISECIVIVADTSVEFWNVYFMCVM